MASSNSNFVKTREADIVNQLNQVASIVSTTPALYGETAATISSLLTAAGNAAGAYSTALEQAEAARAANAAKLAAIDEAVSLMRELNKRVQGRPSVSDAAKAAAGLPVYDTSRTPIGVPTFVPVVIVEKQTRLAHTVRLMDPANPKGGKPFGVAGFNLYLKIGGTAPASVDECTFAGFVSKTRHTVEFPAGDGNKVVWYIAVAANAKGQTGPMSETVQGTIAA